MIDKSVDARLNLEQEDEILKKILSWQEIEEGKAANIPQILESHKEILFTEWESQLMNAERVMNKYNKYLSHQLLSQEFLKISPISDQW